MFSPAFPRNKHVIFLPIPETYCPFRNPFAWSATFNNQNINQTGENRKSEWDKRLKYISYLSHILKLKTNRGKPLANEIKEYNSIRKMESGD